MRTIIGEDISIDEIPQITGKLLVGKFNGKAQGEKALSGWLDHQWKPLLGYSPGVHFLTRGWISFLFWSDEDCELVQNKNKF
jgi:hypothetical protein